MIDVDLNEDFKQRFNDLLEELNQLRESQSQDTGGAEVEALTARRVELEAELRQLRQEFEAARRQLTDAAQRRDDLERRLTESQQQLADEQRRHRETQESFVRSSESLSDALKRLAITEARTPSVPPPLPVDESLVSGYREKISYLERLVATREHDIRGLKESIAHLEDENNGLLTLKLDLVERIAHLQEQLKSKR